MIKTRILIVEDEIVVARDIEQQLVELGYEPVAVPDLLNAVRKLLPPPFPPPCP